MLIGLGVGGAVLLVLVIAAVVALVLGKSQLPAPVAIVKVDLADVLREWKANPIAAQEKYSSKQVELSGYVTSIDTNVHGQTYIYLGVARDSWSSDDCVTAYFSGPVSPSVLKDYPKGSRITLRVVFGEPRSWLSARVMDLVPPS